MFIDAEKGRKYIFTYNLVFFCSSILIFAVDIECSFDREYGSLFCENPILSKNFGGVEVRMNPQDPLIWGKCVVNHGKIVSKRMSFQIFIFCEMHFSYGIFGILGSNTWNLACILCAMLINSERVSSYGVLHTYSVVLKHSNLQSCVWWGACSS